MKSQRLSQRLQESANPISALICLLVFFVICCYGAPLFAQGEPGKGEAEFRKLAAQIAGKRLDGAEEDQAMLQRALSYLDGRAISFLNASSEPNLDVVNQQLSTLVVQQPPVGEGYRVVPLRAPDAYALVANFGISGPSAVRLYVRRAGRLQLAGQLDHFAVPDFFDEYLELIPIETRAVVFVTVAGRVDELQTGVFTVFHFDGERLRVVWTSDLVQQSSYSPVPGGLELTYCAQTDEERPRVCRRMTRERYLWENGAWKRVEQADLPPPRQ